MNNESGAERSRIVTLQELMSETPVHGIGYERFNENQRKEVEALLGSFGVIFERDMRVIEALRGTTMMDIIEFVNEPVGSPRRKELQVEVGEALEEARVRAGEQDDVEHFRKAA